MLTDPMQHHDVHAVPLVMLHAGDSTSSCSIKLWSLCQPTRVTFSLLYLQGTTGVCLTDPAELTIAL